MKNILLVFLTIFIGLQVFAQEENYSEENKVYSFVQKKAEPKEGIKGFYVNFVNEFGIDVLPNNDTELIFKLRFVVEKDGTFTDIEFLGVNETAVKEAKKVTKEAKRVLNKMPAWRPAVHNGKIVRSNFTLPVRLRADQIQSVKKNYEETVSQESNVLSDDLIELLNKQQIETEYFEFKCNCTLVNDNNNQEYRFEDQDKTAYYQISIEQKDEKEAEQIIKELKSNILYHGGLVNAIQLSGIKATEISLSSDGVGLFTNKHLILLYTQGYFVVVMISSYDTEIVDVVTQHFKQTFKLKI